VITQNKNKKNFGKKKKHTIIRQKKIFNNLVKKKQKR